MLWPVIVGGGVVSIATTRLIGNRNKQHLTLVDVLAQPQRDSFTHEIALGEERKLGQFIVGLTNQGIQAVKKFKEERVDVVLFDAYSEQLQKASLDQENLSVEQKMANQLFVNSSWLFASTLVSLLIYPPLVVLHIPPMVYISLPFYKQAVSDLFEKRQITTVVVDALLGFGALTYTIFNPPILVIGCAGAFAFAFTNKIITRSKDTTRQTITNLFGEQPKHVWIVKDGIEVEVPFESIEAGDVLVIHAGQMIPVDGRVVVGVASIDQHKLTGEAQPAEKGVGDAVFAATVVLSGALHVQVEKAGSETAAAQIGQILSETASFTSSVELRGQAIADRAAAPTLFFSMMAWPLIGTSKALAILLSGVGYNMKILGPLSVLNYLQVMARQGILIKDGRALEQIERIDTIVFDKTGTLTLEQPHVGSILTCNGYTEDVLLTIAAAAEHRQTHPIARAIIDAAQQRSLVIPTMSEAAYEVGYGIKVVLDQQLVRVGSERFMRMEAISIPADITSQALAAQQQGHSFVYIAVGEQLGGAIELLPTIRPEAKRIIASLRERGLAMAIISGDQQRPTQALATELGIETCFAETLPENKADLIEKLQAEGKFVCFVGDGINDAIALRKAQVSISLRGASTIATDTAQIILMDQTLNQLEQLFITAEQFETDMQVNLVTTIIPGAVTIAGAFLGVVGYAGATGLYFAGLGVGVANAMRPLFFTQKRAAADNQLVHKQNTPLMQKVPAIANQQVL